MKALLSLLMLGFSFSAVALTDPMTPTDYDLLRKFVAGEPVDINEAANQRIYPAVKLEAYYQPQDLVDLGNKAKDLTNKIAKNGIDDDAILKAAAILKMQEASDLNFNSHPHSDAEKTALQNIANLHSALKR